MPATFSQLQCLIARRRIALLSILKEQPDPVPMLVIVGNGSRRWPTGRPSLRTIGTDLAMLRHAELVLAAGQTKGRVYQITEAGLDLLALPAAEQQQQILRAGAAYREGGQP